MQTQHPEPVRETAPAAQEEETAKRKWSAVISPELRPLEPAQECAVPAMCRQKTTLAEPLEVTACVSQSAPSLCVSAEVPVTVEASIAPAPDPQPPVPIWGHQDTVADFDLTQATEPQQTCSSQQEQAEQSRVEASQKVISARGPEALEEDVARPAKRLKLLQHPCGCTVHLICHTGNVVHVPRTDFLIGRNPMVANLTLDSRLVPNMVSRRHARIVSNDDGVFVVDCKSLNGTWLNGSKVEQNVLCQGDVVVIGNPAQSTSDFRFTVSFPASSL